MKTILLFAFGISFSAIAFAQENLAPDQNPKYAISMVKYTGDVAALQNTNNTTVQKTYKAFDWYENKQEKKQERKEFNRQLRLLQAEHPWYYRQYGNRYNNGSYNNGYYNNGYYDNNSYRFWHW